MWNRCSDHGRLDIHPQSGPRPNVENTLRIAVFEPLSQSPLVSRDFEGREERHDEHIWLLAGGAVMLRISSLLVEHGALESDKTKWLSVRRGVLQSSPHTYSAVLESLIRPRRVFEFTHQFTVIAFPSGHLYAD